MKKKPLGELAKRFFRCMDLAEFVFGTHFYTDTAHTSAPDVLEMILHITGTFFGVKIAFSVRCRGRTEDCTSRASCLTGVAIPTPVFDDRKFICKGHVRDDGRKAHFAAVFFGQEKSAFSDKTKP